MSNSLLIFNARLVDETMDGPGCILVIDNKIRSVFQGYFTNESTVVELARSVLLEDGYDSNTAIDTYDAKGLMVTPAFIDMHVHFRDPGLTHKEDLDSGLHAAAAAGYGTVVPMPNTNPVVSSAEEARDINNRAKAIGLSNLYQSISITSRFEGKDTSHLDCLTKEEFPLITEDGHDVEATAVMLEGMAKAGEKDIIVSCHCEDVTLALKARPYRARALEIMKEYNLPAWGGKSTEGVPQNAIDEIDNNLTQANDLLRLAEDLATERNIQIAKQVGCHVHICHISTMGAIESVRRAKQALMDDAADFYTDMAEASYEAREEGRKFMPIEPREHGFSVTCEVTPHHLALTGTEEPNIRALVNPPLRSMEDRLTIIDAIRDGTIDCIATDHAPHTLEDKANGAPGFTGIEASYGICNTVLVKEGQITSRRLSSLMSANPARILHLNKGLLKVGYDADLTVCNPDETWTINSASFFSKGRATPFEGQEVTGKVHALFVSGSKVFEI